MNFLNLTDTSMPLEAVRAALARYCSTPWSQVSHISSTFLPSVCPSASPHYALIISLVEQIRQQHPTVKVKYLAGYCFSGTYILTLLTEGYNFTSQSYSNVKFIEKVSRSQSTPFLSRTPPERCPLLFYVISYGSNHQPASVCTPLRLSLPGPI